MGRILGVATAFVVCLCAAAAPAPAAALDRIVPSGANLVHAGNGNPFYAFGFSYGFGDRHPLRSYLNYPTQAKLDGIADDFAEARRLGANIIRLRVEPKHILSSPTDCRPVGPWAVRQVVDAAENAGLYVDLTGLFTEQATSPEWYDNLANFQPRWDAQAKFWSCLAQAVGNSPAILQYETVTEPIMPRTQVNPPGWYVQGFPYPGPQYIVQDPGSYDPAGLAKLWLQYMSTRIRAANSNALITFGSLPNLGYFFVPDTASVVDTLTPHVYPRTGEINDALTQVQKFADLGKPVILGETFTLNTDWPTLESFLEQANHNLDGAMTFFDGRSPAEAEADGDPLSLQYAQALRGFSAMRSTLCQQRCGAYP